MLRIIYIDTGINACILKELNTQLNILSIIRDKIEHEMRDENASSLKKVSYKDTGQLENEQYPESHYEILQRNWIELTNVGYTEHVKTETNGGES